ncbi:MAG TPA: hypothetical protein VHB79_35700 [Polyangiaceae bacterium]|nr:hypothetical protein [Polyangiaceae bacterium]
MTRPRLSKRLLQLAGGVVVLIGSVLSLWLAIHVFPGAGPWLANGLRSVIGSDAVTWLEEASADLEDGARRLFGSRRRSRTLEQAEPAQVQPDRRGTEPKPAALLAPQEPRFAPIDVGPLERRVAAAGDGQWRAVTDPARPEADPLLFATLLHPDAKRPWAEVFVVVMPVERVRVHAVAGTIEPEATTAAGLEAVRSGLVPRTQRGALLAAFNGGFMTRHGQHGMYVDGVTLVSPKRHLCTFWGMRDGSLEIGTWRKLVERVERAEAAQQLLFWRQAAPCMYEQGRLNAALRDEDVKNWGATLDGSVVIRRSAVGLDASRQLLFVGVSNDTTARAIADAMHHAGASDVAQLDVNWSYPKFLVFPRGPDGQRRALGLFSGFVFRPDDYLTRASTRDFFYVVRRD